MPRVLCIDDKEVNYHVVYYGMHDRPTVSIGNYYELVDIHGDNYLVDNGFITVVSPSSNFKTMDELRDDKLNQLNIK